jgi:hypothetical protein
MKGVLKIYTPTAPPSLPPISIPGFDYIIDMNSNKIIIADAYSNTVATLNTINDLNNWLKNVRSKKIRVNVNASVTGALYLVQNEYWMFGKPFEGDIILTDRNIVLYAYTPVIGSNGIQNEDPTTYTDYDVSGLRLFTTFAGIYIVSPYDTYMPIDTIYAVKAPWFTVYGLDGDVYVLEGDYVLIEDSMFRNLFTYALYRLYMKNVSAKGGGYWTLASLNSTQMLNVSVANAKRPVLSLRFVQTDIYVPGNSSTSVTLGVPAGISDDTVVYIENIGTMVRNSDNTNICTIAPLPSEVTVNLDPATRTVNITNNTAGGITLAIVYTVRSIIREYTM